MIICHTRSMRKALKIFMIFISSALFVLFVFLLCAKLIPLDFMTKRENITLYDIHQEVFYESNFQEKLVWYSLDDYPNELIDLLVAIEDKRFYQHFGFDPIRITKAALTNIKANKIIEGGSSITQQMAKNLFLTNQQTFSRKLEELFIATQMEMQYSKKTILEGYLNTLYFGHGIYGFHAASQYFFNKPLSECTTAQIVLMIGVVNGPSVYSPIIDPNASIQRQKALLSYLKEEHFLSDQQANEALMEPLVFMKSTPKDHDASYYIQAVLDEINSMKLESKEGLEVYTSYDPKAQQALTLAMSEYASKDECESSGIILRPKDGSILALAGGKDFTISQYIRPLYSKRQVGSTIKPLLYYNALHAGFTPSTTFMSSPTTFQIDETTIYAPKNYENRYPYRDISLINAIAISDNIYAMKTHLFLGMDVLADSLEAFGINAKPIPSLPLGTSEMSLMQLTSIYNTFASAGYYTKPSFIQMIYQNDQIVFVNPYTKDPLLDSTDTLVLNKLLTAPFDMKNKTVTVPTLVNMKPNVQVAAKSGTSDFDSLIVGFNPDYTVGIWSGFDDARELDAQYYPVSKLIFKETFNRLYEDETVSGWYQKNKKIESRTVDPISGKSSLLGSEYWYKK